MIPIKDNTLYILFRRGKNEHMKNLFERGEIYINTVDYIRNCDNNQERSDPDDSIQKRQFLGDVKVKMCDAGLDINKFGIPFKGKNCVINTDSTEKGNIYCLSGIFTKDLIEDSEVTEFKTNTFGESLVVISNPRKFIARVKKALIKAGYKDIKYGQVKYYPNDFSGYIGPFKKHEYFSPQNEFRFYVPNQENIPIKVYIGSIKDIAIIKENCFLQFEFTDNRIKKFMLI
jgi:hypothetical protein